MKKMKSILCCLAFAMAVSSLQSTPLPKKSEIQKQHIQAPVIYAVDALVDYVPCETFFVEQEVNVLYMPDVYAVIPASLSMKKEKGKTSSGWLGERLFKIDNYTLVLIPDKMRNVNHLKTIHIDPGWQC